MKSKRRILAVSLLWAVALAGCGGEPPAEPVRPVRAMRVGDVTEISGRSFPGRAKATQEVNLSFRVSGPLVEFPVKVGDEVTEGQVLARIDPRDFQVALEDAQGALDRAAAELEAMQEGARPEVLAKLEAAKDKAQADYERALNEFRRYAELIKKKAASQSEYDEYHQKAVRAQAGLRTAEEELRIGEVGAREEDIRAKEGEIRALKASVAAAEDQLEYTHLKAPFAGVVAVTYVENHETVQAKQQILRLLDTSQIEMTIGVPESLISSAPYVKDITCLFDPFPDTKIEGARVKEIGSEASETTRTYPVTLIMDQPDPSTGVRILPGMAGRASGKAQLPDDVDKEGFVVPETAIFSGEEGQKRVWIIDEASLTVRAQPVTPGALSSLGMRVTGLSAGQWIATAGVDYLSEGQKVRILEDAGVEAK